MQSDFDYGRLNDPDYIASLPAEDLLELSELIPMAKAVFNGMKEGLIVLCECMPDVDESCKKCNGRGYYPTQKMLDVERKLNIQRRQKALS